LTTVKRCAAPVIWLVTAVRAGSTTAWIPRSQRSRIDRLFGTERAKARRAIKRLARQHQRELKHMAARFEAETGFMDLQMIAPQENPGTASIRISSRQSIEASTRKR
jgi:hypothetical protein